MIRIGDEIFDSSNADTLTKALLEKKNALTKTQLAKYSGLTERVREWASAKAEISFGSWQLLGKALQNPKPTEMHLMARDARMSWFTKNENPDWPAAEKSVRFEMRQYIFGFLDDQSLAAAQGVNKAWRETADAVMLPPGKYKEVTTVGTQNVAPFSAAEHRKMAVDSFRKAKIAPQIVLYRQTDKKASLTQEEINQFTVSSFPWTPEKTASWILGGIQSRKTFIVITDVIIENLQPDAAFGIPILTREVSQLLISGYTPKYDQADEYGLKKLAGKQVLVFSPSPDNITYSRLNWQDIWDRAAKTLKVSYPNCVMVVQEITHQTLPAIIKEMTA